MKLKALLGTALLLTAQLALAQNFPTRPVTLVVPAPPGGGTDVLARVMAEEIGKTLGQTVLVENKPGASGMLGVQTVAKARPDGYTVLLTHAAPIMNAPFVFKKVPYDTQKDFAFITQVAFTDLVLVVNKDVPAKNMKEFLAWAGSNKNKISYGSYSAGGVGHLLSEYINKSHQLGMAHIAYKGESPMLQDMVGGNVPWGVNTYAAVAPFLASGRLKALAVLGEQRFKDIPNVPTMAEMGFSDIEYKTVGWFGMLAPKATPEPVLARLEQAARAAVASPAMATRFQSFGYRAVGGTGEAFRQNLIQTLPVMGKLAKLADIQPE